MEVTLSANIDNLVCTKTGQREAVGASIRPAWRPVPGTIWSAQSIGAGGFLGRGQIRPAE